MGEQRVAGNVEGYAQKNIGAALVELAAQASVGHVELKERVAGHERHAVQISHIPGADDDAARIGRGLELLHHLRDLVNVAAIGRGPAAPLHAIDGAQIARLRIGPFVPDGHAPLLQPAGVAAAAQKPQKLVDDAFEVHFLGGDEGKALLQGKPHLVAKHAARAGAGAVGFGRAMRVDMAHEVFISGAGGGGSHGR